MARNPLLRKKYILCWKNVLILFAVFILNCIACQNTTVGIAVALAEATIVIILSLLGKTDRAILANNIFLGVSIEASLFVFGEYTYIYSYAYMPFIHRWGCLCCELFILLCVIFKQNGRTKISLKNDIKNLWSGQFVFGFVLLVFTGIFSSLVTIITNDNHVNNTSWFYGAYATEICYWIILIINLVLVYFALRHNCKFYVQFKEVLINFFIVLVIASWASVILGWHGTYSYHKSILLMPLVAFFSITTIICTNFKEYQKTPMFIFAIIGFICMCIKTSPLLGKWILVIGVTIATYFWINIAHKKFFKMLMVIILVCISIAVFGEYFTRSNELLLYKIGQTTESLKIGRGSWLDNVPNSPKVRIEEFVNVFLEYLDKPWYVFFGKGIGGTITQQTNWVDWASSSGAFSVNQRQSGIYNELHESINIMFLKFGLLGLIFFIYNFMKGLKGIKKSPWILMGLLWFSFYVNAYISMYIVASAFLLGMYECDISSGLIKKMKNRHKEF
ncbi:hypothetical protein [Cloacibacillus evryensis]|uniref:hypothetical protein n=1 Tax=Cloacibacillus evryensis TaxID=508460 RepID=UPI0004B23331|nr:hypothetical protein [Cloacibacillus evryensis]